MRVTIKDVSRTAGVSIKTVSRVLNNEKYVGDDKRARVLSAVAELNFRPSIAARSLAGNRSHQIALICDNPSPYYVYEMQSGIRDLCAEEGVRMIAQPYDRDSDTLLDDVESLVDATHVDGLILAPPVTDFPAVLDLLARRGVRVGLGRRRGTSRHGQAADRDLRLERRHGRGRARSGPPAERPGAGRPVSRGLRRYRAGRLCLAAR